MAKLSDYFTLDERQRAGGAEHFGEGYIGSRSMPKADFDAVRAALHKLGIGFLISQPKDYTPKDSSAWFVGVREESIAPNLDAEVQLGRASTRIPG